jgi:hypothetical protein
VSSAGASNKSSILCVLKFYSRADEAVCFITVPENRIAPQSQLFRFRRAHVHVGLDDWDRPVVQGGDRLYADNCRELPRSERAGKAPDLVPFRRSYEETLHLVRHPECEMREFSESELQ